RGHKLIPSLFVVLRCTLERTARPLHSHQALEQSTVEEHHPFAALVALTSFARFPSLAPAPPTPSLQHGAPLALAAPAAAASPAANIQHRPPITDLHSPTPARPRLLLLLCPPAILPNSRPATTRLHPARTEGQLRRIRQHTHVPTRPRQQGLPPQHIHRGAGRRLRPTRPRRRERDDNPGRPHRRDRRRLRSVCGEFPPPRV
ncbi:hypothetical protein CALVIDRAFT_550702, partial [Calocera viscosa TUFC12733]